MEGARLAPRNGRLADDYLRRAAVALEHAYELRPRHIDHPRNVARLHRLWATLLQNPEARAVQNAEAERWYERTLAIAPTHAAVLNEWALMKFDLSETNRALEMLARSLEIDPRYVTTYWILGNLRASTGDPEGALREYDRALDLDDRLLPALSGKGAVLLQLGRLDDAIAANRRALEIRPGDFISRKNLAVLYRDKGALESAANEARAALAVAPKNERDALQQFIADVESRRDAAASAGD
jgi:tetratricopeptide (TPR) repeat protein